MTFRTVGVDMWRKDDWFADLAPDAKLVWIYTFTNDSTSPAGIYRIALRAIANDTGIPLERVKEIIAEFSAAGKLYYENGVIWPVTMRKHQTGELKSTDNLVKKIAKDLAELPDCPLLERYREHYRLSIAYPESTDTLPEPHTSPLEGPSEGLANPSLDTRHLTQDTGYGTQDTDRETGEGPPPKSKPPKPAPAPDPTLKHPAVVLYRERTHITPDPEWRRRMADTVTDLPKWERVVEDWLGSGWNKRNQKGMLEVYAHGPRAPGKNGTEPREHPGITAVRLLMEEEAQEAREHGNTP